MCLRSGGKGGRFFVPHVNPLHALLSSNCVGDPVEGIAGKSVDSLDTRSRKGFHEQFGHRLLRHDAVSFFFSLDAYLVSVVHSVRERYVSDFLASAAAGGAPASRFRMRRRRFARARTVRAFTVPFVAHNGSEIKACFVDDCRYRGPPFSIGNFLCLVSCIQVSKRGDVSFTTVSSPSALGSKGKVSDGRHSAAL